MNLKLENIELGIEKQELEILEIKKSLDEILLGLDKISNFDDKYFYFFLYSKTIQFYEKTMQSYLNSGMSVADKRDYDSAISSLLNLRQKEFEFFSVFLEKVFIDCATKNFDISLMEKYSDKFNSINQEIVVVKNNSNILGYGNLDFLLLLDSLKTRIDILKYQFDVSETIVDDSVTLEDMGNFSFEWKNTTSEDVDVYGNRIPFQRTIEPIRVNYESLTEWERDAYDRMKVQGHNSGLIVDPVNQFGHQKIFWVNGNDITVFPISTGRGGISSNWKDIESGTSSPHGEYKVTGVVGGGVSGGNSSYGGRYGMISRSYPTEREISHQECVKNRLSYKKLSPDKNGNYDSAYSLNDGGMTNTLFTLSGRASVDYIHGTTTRSKIGTPDSHGCFRMLDEHVLQLRKEGVANGTYFSVINPKDYGFVYNVSTRKRTRSEQEKEYPNNEFVRTTWKKEYETEFGITKKVFDEWGKILFDRKEETIDLKKLDKGEKKMIENMDSKGKRKGIMVNRNKIPNQVIYFDLDKSILVRMLASTATKGLGNQRGSHQMPAGEFKVFRQYDDYRLGTSWSGNDGVMQAWKRDYEAPKTNPNEATFRTRYNKHVGGSMGIMTSSVIAITEYNDDLNKPALGYDSALMRDIFFHGVNKRNLLVEGKNSTAGCVGMADENIMWLNTQIKEGTYIYIPEYSVYR